MGRANATASRLRDQLEAVFAQVGRMFAPMPGSRTYTEDRRRAKFQAIDIAGRPDRRSERLRRCVSVQRWLDLEFQLFRAPGWRRTRSPTLETFRLTPTAGDVAMHPVSKRHHQRSEQPATGCRRSSPPSTVMEALRRVLKSDISGRVTISMIAGPGAACGNFSVASLQNEVYFSVENGKSFRRHSCFTDVP